MSAQGPQVWERVPKRNPNFTGRANLLNELRKSVNTVTAVVAQPQALQGLGGVGKTQLAIEYAWQYRAHYDLVWWISAEQPMLVPSSLAAMQQALGLPSVAGVEQATQQVLRALESGVPYRSWLVVFDNAEEPEDIKNFIPRGPGHVLITSRNSRWSDYEPTIEVDVFKREESLEFLSRRLRGNVDPVKASLLAERLGDLPLALEQAAALLSRTLMSVDDYVGLLEAQTAELLDLEKAPTYPQTMTAAWQLSVSQLENRVPEAVELLRCCAFFGPEPIPRDVFRWNDRLAGSRMDRILSDPILLANALSSLERYALVKIEAGARTIQVHRLNQALLRNETPEKEKDELRHEVHLLLAGEDSSPDDTSKWPYFEQLFAHLAPSEAVECHDPDVRGFALDMARFQYVRGSYREAQSLLERYIRTWAAESGERHKDVLAARVHLGNVHRALARYTEAHETEESTLRVMREVLGTEHKDTLWAMAGYAATLRGRGDFLRAREIDEELLEQHLRTDGDGSDSTLRARNNLAVDYLLTSEYGKAQQSLREIYLRISTRGRVSSRFRLQIRTNLSRAARLHGQFEVATDMSEDAYNYGVSELGTDHPDTLLAAKDYAVSLRKSGRLPEAVELLRDTHDRMSRAYGDGHADTMAAALGLSNALRVSGDLEGARRLAEQALEHYPEVFGDDHPFTLACRMNLALLCRTGGDPAEARQMNEEILRRLSERVSGDHDYAVSCAINLQNDLAALGEHQRARQLGEETRRRVQRYFAPDHDLSLVCEVNLSHDLRATGDVDEANRLLDHAVLGFEQLAGRGHPDTLAVHAGTRLDRDFDPPPI